jgi:pimeloyl-ACP methyl ester carboxylesterase
LRQLSPKDALFQNVPAKIDFTQIIAVGHSFGGAAAALALRDQRIRGGINVDGRLFNPVLETGTDQPFMLLGREKHADEDPTWNQFWRVLRGPKAMVGVAGTTHSSFTDIPALIQALGLPEEVQSMVEAMLGSVGGGRMQEIVAELTTSFFTWVLKRDNGPLVEVVDGFPEVSVKKSSFKGV